MMLYTILITYSIYKASPSINKFVILKPKQLSYAILQGVIYIILNTERQTIYLNNVILFP